jgi:CRP-like cAMP-binding protein
VSKDARVLRFGVEDKLKNAIRELKQQETIDHLNTDGVIAGSAGINTNHGNTDSIGINSVNGNDRDSMDLNMYTPQQLYYMKLTGNVGRHQMPRNASGLLFDHEPGVDESHGIQIKVTRGNCMNLNENGDDDNNSDTIDELTALLKSTVQFANVPVSKLKSIGQHCHMRSLHVGDIVLNVGETSDYMYLIKEGSIECGIYSDNKNIISDTANDNDNTNDNPNENNININRSINDSSFVQSSILQKQDTFGVMFTANGRLAVGFISDAIYRALSSVLLICIPSTTIHDIFNHQVADVVDNGNSNSNNNSNSNEYDDSNTNIAYNSYEIDSLTEHINEYLSAVSEVVDDLKYAKDNHDLQTTGREPRRNSLSSNHILQKTIHDKSNHYDLRYVDD